MTTTAVRAFRASPRRCGDVLNETVRVVPRDGDVPPRAEDAFRVGVMRRIAAARLESRLGRRRPRRRRLEPSLGEQRRRRLP